MHENDLALNDLQGLICHKNKSTQINILKLKKKYTNYSQNFFHKYKTQHCLELVYNKNYFNLAKNICSEAIQNGVKSSWTLQTWTEVSH